MPYYRIVTGFILALFLWSCKPSRTTTTRTTTKTANTAPARVSLSSLEAGILAEVNRHRKSKGLQPLKTNSIVETEASLHSQRMASKQVAFGHSGFETRVSRMGKRLGGVSNSAENVAFGRYSAREVVQTWLKSTPHRRNIEGRFNLTGIGVSKDSKGTVYYTQLFALKN